tara:strand:+ start:73 stop:435 length:363 start_codon:yes stop_codon:yes gene_type:complete
MQIKLLKCKVHRTEVTDANTHYEGSLGIDVSFMNRVSLRPYEKILCGNINNENRFESYAIPEPAVSKSIILNGATSHLGKSGDRIIIMSFALISLEEAENWKPKIIVLGESNKIINTTNC